MPKLFVYDASEVNTEEYKTDINLRFRYDPVTEGFREALKQLAPKTPFLVRGIFGDYDYRKDEFGYSNGRIIIKNLFGNRNLKSLLDEILKNGTDRNEKNKRIGWRTEKLPKGIRKNEFIWALEYSDIKESRPYRHYDDMGEHPQGTINDFSMIIDRRLYIPLPNSDFPAISFFQPDIKKRRKAILGIIISDTNPNRPKLKPLRFDLNTDNLDQVVEEIEKKGYFALAS